MNTAPIVARSLTTNPLSSFSSMKPNISLSIQTHSQNSIYASNPMEPYIMLNDSHGVYIPKLFCDDISESECPSMGIEWSDVQTCQAGPDHEWYWEAWQTIENNFEQADDKGTKWYLYQNGDLWCYPEGYQFPEEF